ncbi:hypothetical protein QL285_066621 [Trifolium repens]|nr:hypothetical protein QL285_066621 [Trifolium repens]
MNFNVEEENQPQRFWELQILNRHLANNSVLHFPHRITSHFLQQGQNQINLVLHNTNIAVNCNIRTDPRNGLEKFITIGWFQFLMDANIEAGTRVRLTLSDPPENLIIAIIDP